MSTTFAGSTVYSRDMTSPDVNPGPTFAGLTILGVGAAVAAAPDASPGVLWAVAAVLAAGWTVVLGVSAYRASEARKAERLALECDQQDRAWCLGDDHYGLYGKGRP